MRRIRWLREVASASAVAILMACSSTPTDTNQSPATPIGGTAGAENASGTTATGGTQNAAGSGGVKNFAGTSGAQSSAGTSGAPTSGGVGGMPSGGQVGAGAGGAAGAGTLGGVGGAGGGDSKVTYSTSFDVSESPLSEGGKWKHGNPWFTKVVANGGNVYGTSPNPANPDKYEDSYAFLGGMGFPPNQYASGTVYKQGATGGYLEIELQLRVSDSGNSTRGYECFLHQGGAYLSVARWSGGALTAPATLSYFDILAHADNITAPKDGDLFEAQIVGSIITVKLAGALILTVDVSKFDGAVIPSGDPGIGFDAGASGAETKDSSYGFKDFSAKSL